MDNRYVQQFKKGSLEMILLSLIGRKETYGYEIITELNDSASVLGYAKEGNGGKDSHDYTYRHSEHSVYNLSDDAPKDAEHPEGGAHHQAAYRQPDVLRHLSEICRCRHIFAVFDFLFF